MTIEFMSEPLSSDIHWGPHVPIRPLSKKVQFWLNVAKTSLFSVSLFVQLVLFIGVRSGHIGMPQNIEDDADAVDELAQLERICGCGKLRDTSLPMDPASLTHDQYNEESSGLSPASDVQGRHHTPQSPNSETTTAHKESVDRAQSLTLSVAFFENIYIALWVGKDVFWSMGTGDWETVRETRLVLSMETIGLFLGFLTLLTYSLTAYIYRRSTIAFLDSCTVLLWIAANFTWMAGEFFLRFHNMEFDDGTEGNDRDTRIVSTVLFTSGIMIQLGVIAYLSSVKPRQARSQLVSVSSALRIHTFDSQRGSVPGGLLSAYRPQKYSKLENSDGVEDEVLF